jgi:ribonuclease Z
MRIEFLGTGGYHPNDRRQTACIFLPELGVMFDAGTSVYRLGPRLQTDELEIFLSHAHLDHIVGLTFLLPLMLGGPLKRCRVHGTNDTLSAVRTHLFAEKVFPVEPEFQYVELAEEVAIPRNGILRHIPLKHPGASRGFRIDWPDRSLAYITDTIADGSYTEFVRGVNVLIHECYFPDSRKGMAVQTGHSHTTPVAELARDANVGRMYLVHIDPLNVSDDPIELETARKIFPDTELAEDRLVVEF